MRKIPDPTVSLLLEDKNFSERKANYMKVVKPMIKKNWKNYVLVLVILIGTITDMKIMAEMDGDTFVNLSDSVVPENNGPCGFIKTL